MPIGRYFVYIGSLLLALLLLVDWYTPPPSTEQSSASVDRSTIRIHSSHKWPQAVVYDTTFPTFVPPPVTATGAAEPPAPQPAREAYAMVPETPPAARPADAAKAAKPHVRRARTARPPDSHIASPEPFGFGNDWFAPPRREASAGRNEIIGARSPWRPGW